MNLKQESLPAGNHKRHTASSVTSPGGSVSGPKSLNSIWSHILSKRYPSIWSHVPLGWDAQVLSQVLPGGTQNIDTPWLEITLSMKYHCLRRTFFYQKVLQTLLLQALYTLLLIQTKDDSMASLAVSYDYQLRSLH